ncbi:hypothetical protein B0H16DRAFT_897171 [Mycena metata]|uniref:Uncharacterized protein n=1 Tax=Mycena metata TaxID=1033252 RepID=A0AAD7N6L3_9AGAR|nr:hypothetical protein B0H16DRAFT_897171 [Mycena metata]
MGTILVLQEPLTMHQIIALLADIPEKELDVKHFLQQFHSVLDPGTTAVFENATPQMHKSFRDYITRGHAPTEFRIHTGEAHFATAKRCLEVIVQSGSQPDTNSEYSVSNWHRHLQGAVEGGVTCEDEKVWTLLEEAVVNMRVGDSSSVFCRVATAGWGLLKRDGNKYAMERISSILTKAKEVCTFS